MENKKRLFVSWRKLSHTHTQAFLLLWLELRAKSSPQNILERQGAKKLRKKALRKESRLCGVTSKGFREPSREEAFIGWMSSAALMALPALATGKKGQKMGGVHV